MKITCCSATGIHPSLKVNRIKKTETLKKWHTAYEDRVIKSLLRESQTASYNHKDPTSQTQNSFMIILISLNLIILS